MAVLEAELTRFNHLNSISEAHGAVFFGSDCFAELPVGELARDFNIDLPVYNRSIEGLLIGEAEAALADCVYRLNPAKIFINLGDADLRQPDFSVEKFLSAYEWLLYTLHNRSEGRIYVVSVASDHPAAARVNEGIRRIAQETGCTYIDISAAARSEKREIRIFDLIKHYLREHPISFGDVFGGVSC